MKDRIVVIYEGKKTEKNIVENIQKCFSNGVGLKNAVFIDLAVAYQGNIYDLYSSLEGQDDYDVFALLQERIRTRKKQDLGKHDKEILKLKRGKVSQIYLFFDFDLQHGGQGVDCGMDKIKDNLKRIEEMLLYFDDENSHGKLYVSYPMVEALRDIAKNNICSNDCHVNITEVIRYKEDVGDRQKSFQDSRKYTNNIWDFLCLHAISKANCLINGMYEYCGYDTGKDFSQGVIFAKQKQAVLTRNYVYVLSGFPFFLLEYFGKKLWENLQLPKGYQLQVTKECHNK